MASPAAGSIGELTKTVEDLGKSLKKRLDALDKLVKAIDAKTTLMQAAGAGDSVRVGSKGKSTDSAGGLKKKGVSLVEDGDGESLDTVVGDITAVSNMCNVIYCLILCREGWQCHGAQINE
eukprot:1540837-Rhodomonas_salina.1